jgi:hypothetical protein
MPITSFAVGLEASDALKTFAVALSLVPCPFLSLDRPGATDDRASHSIIIALGVDARRSRRRRDMRVANSTPRRAARPTTSRNRIAVAGVRSAELRARREPSCLAYQMSRSC